MLADMDLAVSSLNAFGLSPSDADNRSHHSLHQISHSHSDPSDPLRVFGTRSPPLLVGVHSPSPSMASSSPGSVGTFTLGNTSAPSPTGLSTYTLGGNPNSSSTLSSGGAGGGARGSEAMTSSHLGNTTDGQLLGVGVTVGSLGLTGLDSYCLYPTGSLEYDSNPPPSSTGSTNSSATEVVGVSVSLAGTGSTSSSHRGRGAGNGASMPGSGASAGSGNGVELPDTKEGIEELCPVCGDKVSGYHYGLLTCESCKGFFKRTVQNKKVYTCVADRSCHIDKSQRKRCPFCRFQKCLEVGMKLEAVRADRMRGGRNKFGPMYKRDRARKLQTIREKQLRPGGASTPSSQSSNGGSTPSSQAGLYATDSNLYSVSGQPSTTSVPLYVTGGGIKHEIQIPQVSSLTSSPDSSPSPLGMPATSYASHSSTGNLGAANTSLGSEKPLWNNNNTPGNLNNPASNHPNTPSPTHQHPHLSPKQFQFDGLLGSSSTSGSSLGAGLTGLSSGTSPGATPIAKMPPLVREFVQSLDDKEWQSALFGLLQSQSYNQVEVDLFELLCKVLDQNLFSQVDWARNSVFFKDLRVDDQMKMLQHSWSDLLILDHIHQRMHNHLPDETTLPNGQKFELVSLAMLGAPELAEPLHDLTRRLQEIRFDVPDYICLKFLLLLNPDVRGLMNRRHVVEAHDQVQQALFDYTLNCYPQVPDKFSKLLAILPDVHSISSRGEDFLYFKHLNGFAPTQTLLMEMLHAKRR